MPRPRRLMQRQRALGALPLSLLALLAVAPAHASAATACQSSTAAPAVENLDQLEGSVLCLVNRERTSRGLRRLKRNVKLDTASVKFSRAMVIGDFFSHVSPGGSTMKARISATGYLNGTNGWSIGENIAYGTGHFAAANEIVDGWMHSPGHRANILDRGFREIGIGIALGAPGQDGGATYTTDFGTRM